MASDAAEVEPATHQHSTSSRRRWSGIGLAIVVVAAAYFATRLHRLGHTVGDDFALYLRQARSIFEGNISQVISDNRFLWANSTLVTPPIYPWGFPLLLSPFVHLWGLDYDRLKLVVVACLCVWLLLFHGIVRRRAGRLVALGLTAVFATSIPYLFHTDQLLSEFPHLAVMALTIWWLDRLILTGSLLAARPSHLLLLGLLVVAAFNVRREGVVLLAVIAVAQFPELWRRCRRRAADTRLASAVRALPWQAIALPYLTFVIGTVVFQLLIPSTLLPDNDNDRKWIGFRVLGIGDSRRDRSYPRELMLHLGIGRSPADDADWVARYGLGLLVIAGIGALLACLYKPRLNVPLLTLVVATMLIIGTHPRWVARYYMQVTPFVAYFALMLPFAGYHLAVRWRRAAPRRWLNRAVAAAVTVPALWVTAVHLPSLFDRMEITARRNEAGPQSGPVHPNNLPVYDAVLAHTRPDDVIVYYRARTMTLYTDRRAVQGGSVARVERLGDYFMVNRTNSYSQPRAEDLEPELLAARGWVPVWENNIWTLWKLPESDGTASVRTATNFDPVRGLP